MWNGRADSFESHMIQDCPLDGSPLGVEMGTPYFGGIKVGGDFAIVFNDIEDMEAIIGGEQGMPHGIPMAHLCAVVSVHQKEV